MDNLILPNYTLYFIFHIDLLTFSNLNIHLHVGTHYCVYMPEKLQYDITNRM